jgi:hypothetical protein
MSEFQDAQETTAMIRRFLGKHRRRRPTLVERLLQNGEQSTGRESLSFPQPDTGRDPTRAGSYTAHDAVWLYGVVNPGTPLGDGGILGFNQDDSDGGFSD